jgi:drug/metabolite transporter (DMT)-like permease
MQVFWPIEGGQLPNRDGVTGFALTLAALVAFATNSILCRLALGNEAIDAYSFTAVRLGSGALVLLLLNASRKQQPDRSNGSWSGTLFLILYAFPFSLAYVRLDTGTGALLLFGAVQLTMIGHGLRSGERPQPLEWLGLGGAVTGVAYLVFPGLTSPDPIGAAFMVTAGIGWGGYSIIGKSAGDPASVTAGNFRRAALLVVPTVALAWGWLDLSPRGLLLAAASGALASGLGYTVWYAALKHLALTRAALAQLAVPVIAAGGGVVFVGESITLRLALASAMILGSIAIGILGRMEPSTTGQR